MKRGWVFLGFVLAVALAIPLFGADKGDPAAGKAVYMKKCGSCHNLDGSPKDAIAKMFKVEMRDLSSKEVQAASDADLEKIITDGKGKMKGSKDISAKDMADLIAYIRSIAKK